MSLPVVIAHSDYNPSLEFVLRQAVARVPAGDLTFLGSPLNDRFAFVRHVDGTSGVFCEAADKFAALYRHMSSNSRMFELAALQRWFRIRALMRAEGMAEVLVLDSDVLLFATPAEIRALWFDGSAVGLAVPGGQEPYEWCASGHSCYWPIDRLDAFCEFLMRLYAVPAERALLEGKWAHHLASGTLGGVCDMTAFYLFARHEAAVANVSAVRAGTTFDHNINTAANETEGEYEMRGGVKAVAWDAAGNPTVRRADTGEAVRFLTLHFQGHAKAHIPAMYRGPAFADQARARLRIRAHYALRGPASRVAQPLRLLRGRLGG